MRTFDQIVLPVATLVLSALVAFTCTRMARVRRRATGGDLGDFWTRVVLRVCLFLALPVLASGIAALFPDIWNPGYHLHFDLTGIFGRSYAASYRAALFLPLVVWTVLLLFGVTEKPGPRNTSRWLAGAIGFESSRRWVLVWTLPLAAILAAAFSSLGGGPVAYPAAAWGTLAVLLLSLIGVAWSAGDPIASPAQRVVETASAAQPLAPWPAALKARGVQLTQLASWPASRPARSVRREAAGDLADRLRLRGAREVAPELIEAVNGLLHASDEDHGRSRLVFCPDDCGQTEVIALAAEMLDQRFHAATLVVTVGDAPALATQLQRWLPGGARVVVAGATGDVDADALVVVADAQTLSDRLLPQLKNPHLLKRFGLVVWWHLEAYTGVLAANLWAISRRLHRLFEAAGRHDVRTVVFVRSTPHGDAQMAAFVRRLLPHPLPAECEKHVQPRFARAVQLHVLESHHDYFTHGDGRSIGERYRHLPLIATRVSVEEGWPTYLETPPDIASSETIAFLQTAFGDEQTRERLQVSVADASAQIRTIAPGEVLSLLEIIRHGGRAASDGVPHHVGITLPANPYVAHVLSTLTANDNGDGFTTSRRLVAATAQPDVVRRHLLLALDELPDTRSGLLKNFLWNESAIHQTLEEIANEGKLTRREVRFLDGNGDLQREHEYKSRRPAAGERRPLDTVGGQLVDVRDPAAGHESDQGIRMRVDPERLTIQAYPHRLFLYRGQRYRIADWSSSAERVAQDGWIPCAREEMYGVTWRIRNASVFNIESAEAVVGVGRSRGLLSCLTASLVYQEDVVGWLRLNPNLTTGAVPVPETHRLSRAVSRNFQTRALILRFPDEQDAVSLVSLAQMLRDLLPVHLGVEEDALEVVPLTGEFVQNRPAYGLAIVDLYPGGIGLVDAIGDDNAFLLQLLEWGRNWLAACACRSDQGCPRCLRSPAALAANMDLPPMRSAALDLLRQVV
ncbi:MAG TPA: DUF1998 domain-containing protein [Thermoanaerobaculia bacterium]|jgi:hypothetical protein